MKETILERILNFPPWIFIKAAAVSSQELSMPNIMRLFFLLIKRLIGASSRPALYYLYIDSMS